jgi:hypothetical protein
MTAQELSPLNHCGNFMSRFPRLCLATAALLISVNIAVATGLIPAWGRWYSDRPEYRQQTEAFLAGSLAPSSNLVALSWDWAWCDGASQQVWGLGVPAWRLPFEAAARLCGWAAFPDRIAFVVALFTSTYSLLATFLPKDFFCQPLRAIRDKPEAAVAPLLLVLPPAFLNLCRTRFWVYEEAQAYAYLAAIGLLAFTIAFVAKPTRLHFILLALFSGLTGFVRPTLLSYGVASLIIAVLKAYSCRWPMVRLFAGIAACILGCALLAATNYKRFGAITEFGHGVNLNDSDRMRYASRFDHPFAYEPLCPAARELFCSLFRAGDSFNGDDWYAERFFKGQSSTLRWREFYFTTFGLDALLIVGGAWSWFIARQRSYAWTSFWTPAAATPHVLVVWSFLSAIPLWLFYLRSPFLASRYLVDFAPAIASGMAAAIFAARDVLPAQWTRHRFYSLSLLIAVGAWWATSMLGSRVLVDVRLFPRSAPLTLKELPRQVYFRSAVLPHVPASYEVGMNLRGFGLNGAGWEPKTGRTRASAIFFVVDPEAVEMEVAADGGGLLADTSTIRARIGTEELILESNALNGETRLLRFRRPPNTRRLEGCHVLFVGLVTPAELHRDYSLFRLLSVRWSGTSSERNSSR